MTIDYIDCIYCNWVFDFFWRYWLLWKSSEIKSLWVFLYLFTKDVDSLGVINRSARHDDLLYRYSKETGHSSLIILNFPIVGVHIYFCRFCTVSKLLSFLIAMEFQELVFKHKSKTY